MPSISSTQRLTSAYAQTVKVERTNSNRCHHALATAVAELTEDPLDPVVASHHELDAPSAGGASCR